MPETQPEIIRQGDDVLYPKLFFNRPVNPIQQPIVTLIDDSLSSLSTMFEIVGVLGARPQSIAVLRQRPADAATVGVVLIDIQDSNSLVEQLELANMNSSLIFLRLQTNLTSQLQIALSHFLLHADVPVILTGACWQLFTTEPALLQKSNLILAMDTGSCMKFINALKIPIHTSSGRGAFQLVDLAQAVIQRSPHQHVMIYDHNSVVWARQNKVGLWYGGENLIEIMDYVFAVTAAMLAYPLRNMDQFIERSLNGAYILHSTMSQGKTKASEIRRLYQTLLG